MPKVYLIHFSKPLAHAQHYCGYTPGSVFERLAKHEHGIGSNLCKHAVANGAELELIRVWNFEDWGEARAYERRLKNTHNLKRYCPLCKLK